MKITEREMDGGEGQGGLETEKNDGISLKYDPSQKRTGLNTMVVSALHNNNNFYEYRHMLISRNAKFCEQHY